MKEIRLWAGWVALAALGSASLCAQTPDDRFKEGLDPMIEQRMRDAHMAGLAVGVVLGGRLVYARGFGLMNMNHPDRPVTPGTLFHMASITKVFVATALMQLVEQGKVDLDAKVTKYLPYFRVGDPRSSLADPKEFDVRLDVEACG